MIFKFPTGQNSQGELKKFSQNKSLESIPQCDRKHASTMDFVKLANKSHLQFFAQMFCLCAHFTVPFLLWTADRTFFVPISCCLTGSALERAHPAAVPITQHANQDGLYGATKKNTTIQYLTPTLIVISERASRIRDARFPPPPNSKKYCDDMRISPPFSSPPPPTVSLPPCWLTWTAPSACLTCHGSLCLRKKKQKSCLLRLVAPCP